MDGERVTDGRSPILSRLLCDTAGDQPTLAQCSVIALRGLIEVPQRASERANERTVRLSNWCEGIKPA